MLPLIYLVAVPQLTVKALHVRPESGRSPQECCLRVSLMPLRLNIDQVGCDNEIRLYIYNTHTHIFDGVVLSPKCL